MILVRKTCRGAPIGYEQEVANKLNNCSYISIKHIPTNFKYIKQLNNNIVYYIISREVKEVVTVLINA